MVVCEVFFDRPKDWLDIDQMVRWGTEVHADLALGWFRQILGPKAPQVTRLATVLDPLS